MKRIATICIAALLCWSLVGAGAVAADTPEECEGEVGNATVEDLCDRVAELEETNDELDDENTNLEREIVELENELDSYDEFPSAMAEAMENEGAVHPFSQEGEPALFAYQLDDVDEGEVDSDEIGIYEYVGAGQGDHSLNGYHAWDQVEVEEVGDGPMATEAEIHLSHTPPGMDSTQTVRAESLYSDLDEIEAQMNTPEAVVTHGAWAVEEKESAQTWETWMTVLTIVGIAAMGYVGARVEGKHGILQGKWNKEEQKKVQQQLAGGEPERDGLIATIKGWFSR